MEIKRLVLQAYATAVSKGFWSSTARFPVSSNIFLAFLTQKLALVHSEISEAVEELRELGPSGDITEWRRDDTTGKPEGFAIELADVIIRVADLAGYLNIDLDAAIREKMEYDSARPPLHGKQF